MISEASSQTAESVGLSEPRGILRYWYTFRGHPSMLVGFVVLFVMFLAAAVGPYLIPYPPLKTNPDIRLLVPSGEHLMGTDGFGRDIFSRAVFASRLDLTIAFSVVPIALGVGSLMGTISGYYRGVVDDVIMRITDILLSFPSFILALTITAILGNSVTNVILAIAIAYIPYFVRLTRGQVLSARELDYAEAARCVGNPGWRVMFLHLMPNCLTPALVQATLCLGWAILDASGLAFLGLGIRPPTAEWGVMVSEGSRDIISGQWWTSFFPGAMIVLTAFSFNLIGDSLRDITDPEDASV